MCLVVPCQPIGDLDELQVVDDEQIKPVLHLVATGLAADIHQRRIGIVVDVERMFGKLVEYRCHLVEVLLVDRPLFKLPGLDTETLAEQATEDFFLGHFKGKNSDNLLLFESDVRCDVEGQRGFSHARATRENNKLTGRDSGQ